MHLVELGFRFARAKERTSEPSVSQFLETWVAWVLDHVLGGVLVARVCHQVFSEEESMKGIRKVRRFYWPSSLTGLSHSRSQGTGTSFQYVSVMLRELEYSFQGLPTPLF